jgi:hypothetical protein
MLKDLQLFKVIGKTDLKKALEQLKPLIDMMEKENIPQWGLKGRVTEEDEDLDFGEGKTRPGVKLSDWCHWRDDQYNSGWLAELIASLSPREVGRIRIMQMRGRSCYSWHKDLTPRVHVPLITNPECFMVIRNESRHLYKGAIWWTNTTQFHTAMNCSENHRYHLILEVSE